LNEGEEARRGPHRPRSVPEGKHAQAVKIVGKALRSRSGEKYDDAVRELIELCAEEIAEGLTEGGGALTLSTAQHIVGITRQLAYASAGKVVGTARESRPTDLPQYVRTCAAEVARETRAAQEAWLRGLKPEQVLDVLLRWDRPGAASMLDRLSFDQRNELVKLILQHLDRQGIAVSLVLNNEPKNYLLWLMWYAFRLHLEEPAAKRLIEDRETPTGLLIDLSGELGPQPKNKRGEPINLAGPILVKMFEVLTGLPNNRIPAPARSNTKLGITFSVDPDVIARWKKHPEWDELHVDTKPDGKGGVHYSFDLDTLLRSARIVMGKKRGPTEKPSDKKSS
jgi:hypothetical protein